MNICICFQFTYLTSGDSHVPCPWQLFPADTLLFPLPSSRVCNQRLGDHTILFSPVLLSFIWVCFDCTTFSQCGGRVSMHWIADKCVSNTCVFFWFVIVQIIDRILPPMTKCSVTWLVRSPQPSIYGYPVLWKSFSHARYFPFNMFHIRPGSIFIYMGDVSVYIVTWSNQLPDNKMTRKTILARHNGIKLRTESLKKE